MSANQRATGVPIVISVIAAVLGFSFAAVSTSDFVKHLDRDVHGLHCSFLPGLGDADVTGESGCYATLMSPYSSVMRESLWGGIPISLPAMAVFAFLAAWGLALLILRRREDPTALNFTVVAWALPLLASAAMAYISLSELDTACKLCIGIYASSTLGFVAAVWALLSASRRADAANIAEKRVWGWGAFASLVLIGVVFVLVPVVAYAAVSPDFSTQIESCGTLIDASDPNEILLPIGTQTNEIPVIEVLDPLCPLCRGFERRFVASSAPPQVSRRILLFPLDSACNWMLEEPLHPGACSISEAVLCAEGDAEEVIAWAFEKQEDILQATRANPGAAEAMAKERFPSLAQCIGGAKVKAKLNGSLRWAVKNQLPILTPQMYVGQRKLCDADTDLGLDYSLQSLFALHRANPNPEPTSEPQTQPLTATASEKTERKAPSKEPAANEPKQRINLGPPPGSMRDEDEVDDQGVDQEISSGDASAVPSASSDASVASSRDGASTLGDLAKAAKSSGDDEAEPSGLGAPAKAQPNESEEVNDEQEAASEEGVQ